ncbi:MAG: hypothetical protein HOP18_13325 [Deltaproteobacteria bacterium]|nr:hypothetical protein [Deltaproteobacteria bacterium]
MRRHNPIPLVCISIFLLLSQPGCFFNAGVSTVRATTGASGTGFLTAIERNGQWEGEGRPPQVGDETDYPLYRRLQKEAAFGLFVSGKDYIVSDPYPRQRRRIMAIREVGVTSDNGKTQHYYEVEFNPSEAPLR